MVVTVLGDGLEGGGGLQNIILNIQEVVGYIPNSQQNIEMYFLIEYKMPFPRM